MNEYTLPGDIRDAFSHMSLIGLAAILESAGDSNVAIRWSGGMDPKPQIKSTFTWDEIAKVVHEHATASNDETSWLHVKSDIANRPTAVFSPRVKGMSETEWQAFVGQRNKAIDGFETVSSSELDRRMIGALGMPAYWSRSRAGERLQDDGATRWEMKTRNKGEEFVGNRLLPLAGAVSLRSTREVAAGLSGKKEVDELGKGSLMSRTPTGLRHPSLVDSVRAWCALWAISQFPLRFQTNAIARTAGYFGTRRAGYFYLPVFGEYSTMPRVRAVLSSGHLSTVADFNVAQVRSTLPDTGAGEPQMASEWLRNRGIRGMVTFEMAKSDNASAPEKWARTGVLHRMAAADLSGISTDEFH